MPSVLLPAMPSVLLPAIGAHLRYGGVVGASRRDRLLRSWRFAPSPDGIDTARPSMFRAYGGGPGLRYLMDRFVPRIRARLGDDAVQKILVANPARLFGVAP